MSKINYFATFGSDHLSDFNINSMKIMLYIPYATETQLRRQLSRPPINSYYCTTYPIDQAASMEKSYNMKLISYDELMKKRFIKGEQ